MHIAVSVLWVLLMGLVWLNTYPLTIEANEVGDFLSGAFAPLAFYWLIVGYYLQRQELMLQRKELALSREQLKAQADELHRQADASDKLINFQQQGSVREQIQDRMNALPQRVFALVQAHRPFYKIGPKQDRGDFPVTWAQNVPASIDDIKLRGFATDLLNAAGRWPGRNQSTYGSLRGCLIARDSSAFAVFETEYERLKNWWAECKSLSELAGMDALPALGDQYGIEQLLELSRLELASNDEDQ
jgi:hypothetical protein